VLADLSDSRPTLFVVEDAHGADAATLDLLRYLGRRMDRTRALIVVTYRDDDVGPRHPLWNVLGDLATQPNVRKMSLSLSSESAVRELVIGTSLDPGELHQRTGGNPFFVTDVIASGAIGIPDTVRDAVLNRAARLFEPARSTLDAAAVIGYRVEPDPLTDLARVGAGPVDESLAADRWRLVKGGGAVARSRLSV
jgi:predicted ATPase